MDYSGLRVTVMGLGHFGGGLAAARWFARQDAAVTVSDRADAQALASPLGQLEGERIAEFHLGGHCEADFRDCDLVVVNPAVKPGDPFVQCARQSGVRVTTEIGLFLDRCPAQVVGVTGSNGKSTTAAMTAAILRAAGWTTWLGGNIGGSLLDRLAEIRPQDAVVLELSSFQLWYLGQQGGGGTIASQTTPRFPHVAVVTGFSPNHLDWHGSLEHYAASKQTLLTHQAADDFAVLDPQDDTLLPWRKLVRGRIAKAWPIARVPPLQIPGAHNQVNAACAAAAAECLGCGSEAIEAGLCEFRGLPQRLELCAVQRSRRFYNDSTATTPESVIAALKSLDGPIWLLAGGKPKGFSFQAMAEAIACRAKGAAFYGAAREELQSEVMRFRDEFPCATMETLDEAFAWCLARSEEGAAIVLSPGCASTDQFQNFRHRGEYFTRLAREA